MTKNTISPYDGKPKTEHGLDQNNISVFTVTTNEITPGRARLADWISIILVVCFLVVVVTNFHRHQSKDESMILGAIFYGVLLLGYPTFRIFWRFFLKKQTQIILTAELLMVKRWNGWETFNRTLAHSLYMLPHDNSKIEAEIIDQKIQRGQITAAAHTMRCYSDSYHICLNYVGTRRDIVTVMGHKAAAAILARLILCDSTIDAQTGMGEGTPLNPGDEWNNQNGNIT